MKTQFPHLHKHQFLRRNNNFHGEGDASRQSMAAYRCKSIIHEERMFNSMSVKNKKKQRSSGKNKKFLEPLSIVCHH